MTIMCLIYISFAMTEILRFKTTYIESVRFFLNFYVKYQKFFSSSFAYLMP